MDFSTTGGLSKQETVTLGTRLSSMLVKTNVFIVLERGKMEQILQEQGFQQSGCTTTECAVEVGKMLNVQKMVSGSFGKVGSTYTIDLSLVDVQTAQIEKSFFQDYKGEIDGLLNIMQDIANQIAGLVATRPAAQKPVPEKKTFNLVIESDPKGARLFLNDKDAGATPFKSKAKEGVELEIRIIKPNYKDYLKKITVTDNVKIMATLELSEQAKQQLAANAREQSTKADTGKKSSSKTWWYIGGGALLLGGTAAILLAGGGGDNKETPASTQFPLPPGRP
jgi:TolB-like protein